MHVNSFMNPNVDHDENQLQDRTRAHIVYIPHTRVKSECMFVSVDSVVLVIG